MTKAGVGGASASVRARRRATVSNGDSAPGDTAGTRRSDERRAVVGGVVGADAQDLERDVGDVERGGEDVEDGDDAGLVVGEVGY